MSHLKYNPDDELLFLFYVRTGNYREVRRCLSRAGPTVKVLVNGAANFWGNTGLHMAAKRNDKEMMQILLKAGADPTIVNMWDQPALPQDAMV